MAVEVFDGAGRAMVAAGELVCTRHFPVMPLRFWNDPDGESTGRRTSRGIRTSGGMATGRMSPPMRCVVIYGRSDTTLNPGGVRIGTAEIYRQVEQLPEIVESVRRGGSGSPWRARDGSAMTRRSCSSYGSLTAWNLDDALCTRLRDAIRRNTSPHHVPRRIHAVSDIPRTVSGKIAELAVREAIHGRPADNAGALANPGALAEYQGIRQVARFVEDGYSSDRPWTGGRRQRRAGTDDDQIAVH